MGPEGQCHGKIDMAKNPWKGNTADNLRKQRGNSLKTKSGQKGSGTGTDPCSHLTCQAETRRRAEGQRLLVATETKPQHHLSRNHAF